MVKNLLRVGLYILILFVIGYFIFVGKQVGL